MEALDQIMEPVREPMARFEGLFAEALGSGEPPLRDIVGYLLDSPGKRVRPLLVFLTASLFGDINERTDRVATFVEMLHTATLLHDDVVDGDTERRGKPSVNARWDNVSAILTGDFLLARALLLLSDSSDTDLLSEMLHTSLAMSEGELVQNHRRKNALTPEPLSEKLSEEAYLDIITHKTAMLMRSCCVAGALSVGAPAEQIPVIGDFGLRLGQVFQMRDDLLDADDLDSVAWAQRLLPGTLSSALESLNILSVAGRDPAILLALRKLALFCAQRSL